MQFAISQQYQHQDTLAVAITAPNGDATALVISVASPFSPVGKAAQFATAEALRKDGAEKLTAKEWDAKLLDALVQVTVAWEGVTDTDGNVVPCEAGRVRDLYEQVPWIREQVQAAVNDRQRFFAAARTA